MLLSSHIDKSLWPVWKSIHGDVIKWKHFPRYWPYVRGIHRWPVDSPQQGQWCGAMMLSLICAWTNGWANNRDDGDLRRHRTPFYITVIRPNNSLLWIQIITCGCDNPPPISPISVLDLLPATYWSSEFVLEMVVVLSVSISYSSPVRSRVSVSFLRTLVRAPAVV